MGCSFYPYMMVCQARDDIERLKNEVPKQEVGRLSFKELTLSRANKSVRVFNHVVDSLSEGKQPDLDLLSKVGYLYEQQQFMVLENLDLQIDLELKIEKKLMVHLD